MSEEARLRAPARHTAVDKAEARKAGQEKSGGGIRESLARCYDEPRTGGGPFHPGSPLEGGSRRPAC
jgi:hypothetical protein